jgi:hypothetical protein
MCIDLIDEVHATLLRLTLSGMSFITDQASSKTLEKSFLFSFILRRLFVRLRRRHHHRYL